MAETQVFHIGTIPNKPLFRVNEVADLLDVSKQTVYLWIDHGLLEVEKYNRTIRVPRESIINFRLRSRHNPLE